MTLYDQLIAAGLPIASAEETGEVSGLPGVSFTLAQMDTMREICFQYLRPAEYAIWKRINDRYINSKITAKAIPNWAAWSQTDWSNYYNTNISATQINAITNLTDAKAILNKMSIVINNLAKMEIALRDFSMPDLPE